MTESHTDVLGQAVGALLGGHGHGNDTTALWWLGAVAVGLLLVWAAVRAKKPRLPYRATAYLLTRTEREVFERLRVACPDCHVFGQVQYSRLLEVTAGRAEYHRWLNQVIRLSCDLVVCDGRFRPLLVIEIDDPSHELPERQDADRRKEAACAAANLPLARWPTDELPSEAELKAAVREGRKALKERGG